MRMYAGGGKTLEWCKKKCEESSECGVIEYLLSTKWCFIWKSTQTCAEFTTARSAWSIYKYGAIDVIPQGITFEYTLQN